MSRLHQHPQDVHRPSSSISSPSVTSPPSSSFSSSFITSPTRVARLSTFVPRPILTGSGHQRTKPATQRVSFFPLPPRLSPAPLSPSWAESMDPFNLFHSSSSSTSPLAPPSSLMTSSSPLTPFLSSLHSNLSVVRMSSGQLIRLSLGLFLLASALFLCLNGSAVQSSLAGTRWYLRRRHLDFHAIAQRVHLQELSARETSHDVFIRPLQQVVQRRRVHVPHCNDSTPCTFPHAPPQAASPLFIAATSDPSVCVGHQFTQWLYGAYLAYEAQAAYVHSPPFSGAHADAFNQLLGLGTNEVDVPHLQQLRPPSPRELVTRQASFTQAQNLNGSGVQAWLRAELREHSFRRDEAHLADASSSSLLILNATSLPDSCPPHRMVCHPQLNLVLRQKYCLARVRQPVASVYSNRSSPSSHPPALQVAFALQCGDECYGGQQFLSLDSIVTTIHHLAHTARKRKLPQPEIHFFVEQPDAADHSHTSGAAASATAAEYFRAITRAPQLASTPMFLHAGLSAPALLHQLVVADVLVASNSPFSLLAASLRTSVTIGQSVHCGFSVAGYHPDSGIFNRQVMANHYTDSRRWAISEFRSAQQCYNMRRWDKLEDE